jgi:hypothetical protein
MILIYLYIMNSNHPYVIHPDHPSPKTSVLLKIKRRRHPSNILPGRRLEIILQQRIPQRTKIHQLPPITPPRPIRQPQPSANIRIQIIDKAQMVALDRI